MNPPFSRLQEVVNKIKEAKNSEFTIIVPGWENEIWWDELISMVSINFGEYEKLQKSQTCSPLVIKSLYLFLHQIGTCSIFILSVTQTKWKTKLCT